MTRRSTGSTAPDNSETDAERTGEANDQVAGEAAGDARVADALTSPNDPPVPPVVLDAVPEDATLAPPPPTDHELIYDNLTEEEGTAILLAAAKEKLAKRTAAEQFAIDSQKETEARTARQAAPLDFVGLDIGKNGAYVYVKLNHPPIAPDRTVHLHGLTFEHVDTDPDGIWLYRHLG